MENVDAIVGGACILMEKCAAWSAKLLEQARWCYDGSVNDVPSKEVVCLKCSARVFKPVMRSPVASGCDAAYIS